MNGVLGFAHHLLQGGSVAQWMRERQSETRILGWEIRHEGWHGGENCSAHTIGHTGFTGTALWIDFDNEIAWTLLTNRVHPSRHIDTGITEKRRLFSEVLLENVTALRRTPESP